MKNKDKENTLEEVTLYRVANTLGGMEELKTKKAIYWGGLYLEDVGSDTLKKVNTGNDNVLSERWFDSKQDAIDFEIKRADEAIKSWEELKDRVSKL